MLKLLLRKFLGQAALRGGAENNYAKSAPPINQLINNEII
jgi:hypothetical protein